MRQNIGTLDRVIRIIIGLALFLFFFASGSVKYFGLIGIIPIATAFIKWCPLYSIFGIRTSK